MWSPVSESSSACSRASAKRSAFQTAWPARRASISSASSVSGVNDACREREIAASEPITSPSARSATMSAERGSFELAFDVLEAVAVDDLERAQVASLRAHVGSVRSISSSLRPTA